MAVPGRELIVEINLEHLTGTSRPAISRTTVTGQRTGFTLTGFYNDPFAPQDTSQRGISLYYIDSTETRDVASSKHASIRNRIAVFPNPTTDIVTISDVRETIIGAKLYNSIGQCIQSSKSAAASALKLSLKEFPDGLYIIETGTSDGSNSGY